MIDHETLRTCYNEDRVYALQLEIWDSCNQLCDYCYMEAGNLPRRSLDIPTLRGIIEEAAGMRIPRIEWLGGEPLLRPDWQELFDHARSLGTTNNLWTGGLPLAEMPVAEAAAEGTGGGLIAFHISTVDPESYRRLHSRAAPGHLDLLLRGVENLLAAGKPPELLLNSVTFTRQQTVQDMMATIDFFKDRYGIDTCINIYQSYRPLTCGTGSYLDCMPDRRDSRAVLEYAARRSGQAQTITNCVSKQYCSATVAVTNEGTITPCATIRPKDAPSILDDGFAAALAKHREQLLLLHMKDKGRLPEGCRDCAKNDDCWGCRGRAWDCFDDLRARDPACFRNPHNVE